MKKDEWPFDGKVWDLGRKYSWFAVYHLNGDDLLLKDIIRNCWIKLQNKFVSETIIRLRLRMTLKNTG